MKMNIISKWKQVAMAAWMLPAAMLVGCTADEEGPAPVNETGARPFVFAVSTDQPAKKETRGALLNEMSGAFGLLGAKYQGEWSYGQRLNFMYNEAVIGDANGWLTSRGFFVPTSAYNMKFFAYYPYFEEAGNWDIQNEVPVEHIGNDPVALSDSLSPMMAPYFDYTMPADAEDQQDLMYAISEQVHANNQGKLDTIRLHFHHLLTGVSIAAGESAETGTIRRVKLTNLYPKGRFVYSGTTLVADPDATEGPIDVYSDLDLPVGGIGSGYVQADADKSFLLIPQPNATFISEYSDMIVQYEASGKIYTFTKSLADLATSLTTSKNILLKFSVQSLKRIRVTATITDWEHGANFDGAVSDQPVLELEPLINDWETTHKEGDDDVTNDRFIQTGANPTDSTTGDSTFDPTEPSDDDSVEPEEQTPNQTPVP